MISTNEKLIYIIRHGETEFNKKGYLQGSSINSSLNENGQEQANMFFETYKNIKFDKIYTSVLTRSIESVKGFINLGIIHEAYSELNEINWGKLEGKQLSPVSWIKLRRIVKKWSDGQTDLAIQGGESPETVSFRLNKVIDIIISRNDEKIVLVCLHGRALRIFISILMNTPLRQMDLYNHSNLGLYIVKWDYSDGKAQLMKSNDRSHFAEKTFDEKKWL